MYQLLAQIGRLQMQRRIDAEKFDRCVVESSARVRGAAQDGGARDHVRKLATYTHDLARVVDSFKIETVRSVGAGSFRSHDQFFVTGPKPGTHYHRAVTTDGRINEILREALCLRLCANKNRDAENDAAQAEEKRAFAIRKKAQCNVERGGHCFFVTSTFRCRTGWPDRNRSWSATTT